MGRLVASSHFHVAWGLGAFELLTFPEEASEVFEKTSGSLNFKIDQSYHYIHLPLILLSSAFFLQLLFSEAVNNLVENQSSLQLYTYYISD